MKAGNLMSASLANTAQTAGVKAQNAVRTVEKTAGSSAAEGRNDFDDTLQKAQTQEKPVKTEQPQKAEQPVKAEKAEATETAPQEINPQDAVVEEKTELTEEEPQVNAQSIPLDAMLLALSGNNQLVMPQAVENVQVTEVAPQQTQTAPQSMQEITTAMPQAETLLPQLSSLEALLPSENNALNNDVTLQSLVPQGGQSAEQAQQGQQLMNLLAGNNALKAQLTDAMQQTQAEVLPQAEQAAEPQTVQVVAADAGALRAVVQEVEPEKAETEGESKLSDLQKLMGDTVLTVEKQEEQVQPLTNLRAQLQQQNRQSNPQQTQTTTGEVVTQRTQTPGQAAFDSVSVTPKAQDTAAQDVQLAGATLQQPLMNEAVDNAAAVQQAPAQQPQVDTRDVMQQIVQQARLMQADDGNEMVIKLEPQYLGELTMRIAVKGDGTVNATFLAENAQTRSILQGSLMELKQQLEAQGMKVDNVEVGAELSHDFFANSEAGQQGYPYQQSGSARNEAALRNAFEDDAEATSEFVNTAVPTGTETNNATDDGVDYRI